MAIDSSAIAQKACEVVADSNNDAGDNTIVLCLPHLSEATFRLGVEEEIHAPSSDAR